MALVGVAVADAGEIQNKAAVYVKVKLEQVATPPVLSYYSY